MAEQRLFEERRQLQLEELRLRSAALGFSLGIATASELGEAAHAYGLAARIYKQAEAEVLAKTPGLLLTSEQAEVLR